MTTTTTAKIARYDVLEAKDGLHCGVQGASVSSAVGHHHLVQAAMEAWPHVAIERIHMDAEPRQTSKLLKLHSVDKLPGLFFLDADGGLLEFAQGDVTADQIREIMLHR